MHRRKRFMRKRKALLTRLAAIALPMFLGALLLRQTAFAENTYVITDGNRVLTYTTSATDPEEVLGQAGLELGAEDTYTTSGGMGRSAITIQRGRSVTILYRGERIETGAGEETVEQLLRRQNLTLDEKDVVSVPLETPVQDDMVIRVDRVVSQRETYSALIDYETRYYNSPELPSGVEQVLTPGVPGEAVCIADVTYVNGQEAERNVISRRVTVHPVDQVISRGAGPRLQKPRKGDMPVITDSTITLPTGEVLNYTRKSPVRATAYTHTDAGCDLITATGTTVHIGTVAVDPRYIPYGTRMFIVSNDGSYVYGISTAEDCGGAIKGDRVDLYFPTYRECMAFGRRDCTIYFIE